MTDNSPATEPGRFGVIFDDITRQKQVEEELRKVQRLESLAVLAGGIAHDFNNLLGGIFGYIDLAHKSRTLRASSTFLSKALATIDRARELTQHLLTFAEGGAPAAKNDHLFPFIEESVRFALSGSRATCSFSRPADLWKCTFDRTQIGQVIDNIVINAIQAMPQGGDIEIAADNCPITGNEPGGLPAGKYVRLSIKDHGIGMPKEIVPRIFDPFFTTKPKDHGLGLAACYSIVNRHGGRIDVESEVAKGSTFHVYLPAAPGAGQVPPDKIQKRHRGTGTILIMDDEPVMLDTMSDMLTSIGYTVIATIDGREAVERFNREMEAKHPLAAMILDLTVPGGEGGGEIIGRIRYRFPDIPVFVVSGYSKDPVMSRPRDFGFTASISKPFSTADLAKMIRQYLPHPDAGSDSSSAEG